MFIRNDSLIKTFLDLNVEIRPCISVFRRGYLCLSFAIWSFSIHR